MLSDIAYEQISENFWYGIYGSFNVILMKDCGFINASKLCSSGQKDVDRWCNNKSSKELMKCVSAKLDLNMVSANTQPSPDNSTVALQHRNPEIWGLRSLVCKNVHTFNQTDIERIISGSYCHPLLIPHIACWVSPEFAINVSEIVNDYYINEYKTKLEETRMALYNTQESLTSQQSENQMLEKLVNA